MKQRSKKGNNETLFGHIKSVAWVEMEETGSSLSRDSIRTIRIEYLTTHDEDVSTTLFQSGEGISQEQLVEDAATFLKRADYVFWWPEGNGRKRFDLLCPFSEEIPWINLKLVLQILFPGTDLHSKQDLLVWIQSISPAFRQEKTGSLPGFLSAISRLKLTERRTLAFFKLMESMPDGPPWLTVFTECLGKLQEFRLLSHESDLIEQETSFQPDAYMKSLLRLKPSHENRFPQPGVLNAVSTSLVSDYLTTGITVKTKGRFSQRSQQVDYAREVTNLLNEEGTLLLEAGTGTGKSLGYLVPSMEFLRVNPGHRIIISTALKNLQHQISKKEIQNLKGWFPEAFRSVETSILKGRGNYCCLGSVRRRMAAWSQSPMLIRDAAEYFVCIYLIHLTAYRDLVDLESVPELLYKLIPDLYEQIEMFRSDVSCFKSTCDYFGSCVYDQVLKEAARSQLVIINHAKFFNIPDFLFENCRAVIVDEADLFPAYFRSSISTELSSGDCWRVLSIARGNKQSSGWLPVFSVNGHPNAAFEISSLLLQFEDAIREKNRWFSAGNFRKQSTVYLPDLPDFESDYPLKQFVEPLLLPLQDTKALLNQWREDGNLIIPPTVQQSFMVFLNRLDQVITGLTAFSKDYPSSAWCHFVSARENEWMFGKRAVYIKDRFREYLFESVPSWIFTSATLTLDRSFSFFIEEMGLNGITTSESEIVSPFNYREQAALAVASFIPAFQVSDPGLKTRWLETVGSACTALTIALDGRSLILCTSYEQVEYLVSWMKKPLDDAGILLFRQEGSSLDQIREFQDVERSVLIGVDRLWTGVDFPGQTCSQVIIVKLPWLTLDDPELRHRQRMEGPAFWNYYQGLAKLKFRQGTGRLIRSGTDTGVVVVLDSRISQQKNQSFIKNIPEMPVYQFNDQDSLVSYVRRKTGIKN